MPPAQATYSVADEAGLTLLGYIAFLDPPKETAGPAIATLKARGVQVKILTGDNDIVTRKICHDVGCRSITSFLAVRSRSLSPEQLADLAETAAVFAKVSPAQKAAIIDALHRKGHVVGYLGDGINDGPALKAADVGISVESAVDIAKETADIILLEKSLAVLGDGVIEGRKVFGNITKYIKMGASSGFGNMFSVIGASIFLPFLPMAPIQVLTNNLLYDFSQTTIPTDNVDAEYLAVPRRWDIGNMSKFVLLIGPISSIFDYVTFFVMLSVFHAWDKPALFQTGWFVESLLTQTLIIHIIRTAKIPFIESRASAPVIATSLIVAAVGIALPFSWFGGTLGFVPLPPMYWIYLCPHSSELCRPDASDEDMVQPQVRTELNGCLTMSHSPFLSNILVWIGIAFCITQSAIFSGLNLAIFSISKLRLKVEAAGGNRDAIELLALRKDSNLTLATVLWGNVTINVLLTLLSDSVLAGVGAFVFRPLSSRCSARYFRKLIFRAMRCAWRRGLRRC